LTIKESKQAVIDARKSFEKVNEHGEIESDKYGEGGFRIFTLI
jgi:hypothetical protein